jgi:hypothetical protein
MESNLSSSEPLASGGVINSSQITKAFIWVVLLVVLGGGIYFYRIIYLKNINDQALQASSPKGMQDFTPEGYKQYINSINAELSKSELTSDTKKELEFRKALMMLDSQEPDEPTKETLVSGGLTILRDLYNQETLDSVFKGKIALQYLLYYNELFFMPANTRYLPGTYSENFASSTKGSTKNVDRVPDFQKIAMETHMALAYDPSTSPLALDRTFIANRLYLVASYADTYWSTLNKEQKNDLKQKLSADLEQFPKTVPIAFTDRARTVLAGDFYYAYAYEVYNQKSKNSNADSMIKGNYEKARSNVDLSDEYIQSNAVEGQVIDAYYLRYLIINKDQNGAKIREIVSELKKYVSINPPSANVMYYFYRALMLRDLYLPFRSRLLELKQENKDFAEYIQSLHIDFK